MKVKIVRPCTHKQEYYTFFKNLDIYYSTISNWKFINPEFTVKDNKFSFISKKGITYRYENDQYKPNFEYMIELLSNKNDDYVGSKKEKGKLKSLHITIKPQLENSFYGKSEQYGDYNPYDLIKGEGTEIKVTSVYFSFEETQKILYQIFKFFNMDMYFKTQDFNKGTLIQHEQHLRYDEKKENKVGEVISHIQLFCGVSDDQYTKITLDKTNTKFKMYSLKSDRWGDMGFCDQDHNYSYAVKTYRTRKYDTFSKANILRHPKVEVYLDDENTKRKEYPKLSDIDHVRNTQHQILGNICLWANLKHEDFISDLYFDCEKISPIEIQEKTKVLKKIKHETQHNMSRVRKLTSASDSVRDYLNCLITNGQATYKSLMDYTGFQIDWIKRITYSLKNEKIIRVIPSSENIIEIINNNLSEYTRMFLDSINSLEKDHELNRILRVENREKIRKGIKKKILSRMYLPKIAIKKLVSEGFVSKSNGGFYELINFIYSEDKPENYEDFKNKYG